jgi:ankyrin repeat protein
MAAIPPLCTAVSGNDVNRVRELIAQGAAIDEPEYHPDGNSPLIIASMCGFREITTILLEAGASIEMTDAESGWTPLIFACYNGNPEVAEILLNAGANIAAKDFEGFDALYWSCEQGHREAVQLLLQRGAPPSDLARAIAKNHPKVLELFP